MDLCAQGESHLSSIAPVNVPGRMISSEFVRKSRRKVPERSEMLTRDI